MSNDTKWYALLVKGEGDDRKVEVLGDRKTEESAQRFAEKAAESDNGSVPMAVEAASRDEARTLALAPETIVEGVEGDEPGEVGVTDAPGEPTTLRVVGDEFEPTEAELAEAAALAAGMESGEAREAAAVAEAERRTSSTTTDRKPPLRWFRVETDFGQVAEGTDHSVTAAEESFTLPAEAREGESDLTVMAIQARTKDEAETIATAALNALGEGEEVPELVAQGVAKPRWVEHTVAIESEDGRYWVSKTGVLHSSESCRFVTKNAVLLTDETKTAASKAIRHEDGLVADDGRKVTGGTCIYCAAGKAAPLAAAPSPAEDAPSTEDAPAEDADREKVDA